MTARTGIFGRIWRWPVLVGLASVVGLVAALVGDGLLDVVSWLTLAVPVVICARAWWRTRGRAGDDASIAR